MSAEAKSLSPEEEADLREELASAIQGAHVREKLRLLATLDGVRRERDEARKLAEFCAMDRGHWTEVAARYEAERDEAQRDLATCQSEGVRMCLALKAERDEARARADKYAPLVCCVSDVPVEDCLCSRCANAHLAAAEAKAARLVGVLSSASWTLEQMRAEHARCAPGSTCVGCARLREVAPKLSAALQPEPKP